MTKINDYHFPALDWDSDAGAVCLICGAKSSINGRPRA